MSHPFTSRQRFVLAHRGGSKLAPENTMAAFANGLACGCDGLECDVHLSRDGVPVVIHDPTLERTTNASGPVSAMTAGELAALDAGYHFAVEGRFPWRGRGIGVPTLEQLLGAFPHVPVIVEMKQGLPALARAVADVLRRTGAVDRVCVGSFYRQSLDVLRSEAPEVVTSASEQEVRWTLYRSWCRWPVPAAQPYRAFQVPERAGRLRVVSPAFVQRAHRDHARVDVWVIDAPQDIRRLFAWGVDGVITDRPDVAVGVRGRR
jgi:glycerophosphoryl diester phosphodiesterase